MRGYCDCAFCHTEERIFKQDDAKSHTYVVYILIWPALVPLTQSNTFSRDLFFSYSGNSSPTSLTRRLLELLTLLTSTATESSVPYLFPYPWDDHTILAAVFDAFLSWVLVTKSARYTRNFA